jgi:hypothetical protein
MCLGASSDALMPPVLLLCTFCLNRGLECARAQGRNRALMHLITAFSPTQPFSRNPEKPPICDLPSDDLSALGQWSLRSATLPFPACRHSLHRTVGPPVERGRVEKNTTAPHVARASQSAGDLLQVFGGLECGLDEPLIPAGGDQRRAERRPQFDCGPDPSGPRRHLGASAGRSKL